METSPEPAVDSKLVPRETEAPTTPPKLKIVQKIPIKRPFCCSVGYDSIRDPCAVHKRPAQIPRIAPAATTKGPASAWIFMALQRSASAYAHGAVRAKSGDADDAQIGSDVQRVPHRAHQKGVPRPNDVVHGPMDSRSAERRIQCGQHAHPAKNAMTAKVEYSATLALALVFVSSWPPPPRPFKALNKPDRL